MYDLFTKHFVAELSDFLFHDDYRIKLISMASEMEFQLQCACAFSRLGLDGKPDERDLIPGQKLTACLVSVWELNVYVMNSSKMISKRSLLCTF